MNCCLNWENQGQKMSLRDFSGDPVVKTPSFQCKGMGSTLSQGTKLPHAMQHGQIVYIYIKVPQSHAFTYTLCVYSFLHFSLIRCERQFNLMLRKADWPVLNPSSDIFWGYLRQELPTIAHSLNRHTKNKHPICWFSSLNLIIYNQAQNFT